MHFSLRFLFCYSICQVEKNETMRWIRKSIFKRFRHNKRPIQWKDHFILTFSRAFCYFSFFSSRQNSTESFLQWLSSFINSIHFIFIFIIYFCSIWGNSRNLFIFSFSFSSHSCVCVLSLNSCQNRLSLCTMLESFSRCASTSPWLFTT